MSARWLSARWICGCVDTTADLGVTYLLTYSTVQSPSWEANRFKASQEIPLISRNPKIHYRTHKRPPPVPILSQPNLVHIPTSHPLEIRPNIIHPSTPRSSPVVSFPPVSPPRPYTPPSSHPYAPHAQRPSIKYRYSCQIFVKPEFSQTSNFIKIRPVVVELFMLADRKTDR